MVRSSVRGSHLAVLVILVSAVPGHAACDPTTDPDKSDIANARATVAANCDCTGATSHGAYVSCAAQQANTVLVNKSCAGAVKKCASHSICGKPAGAVTCCITTTKGTKCKSKKDAAHCTAKQGTVGNCTSCCDACPAPGSGPSCSTTATTTSTTTTMVSCGAGCSAGTCPAAGRACVFDCTTSCGCYDCSLSNCSCTAGFCSTSADCPSGYSCVPNPCSIPIGSGPLCVGPPCTSSGECAPPGSCLYPAG